MAKWLVLVVLIAASAALGYGYLGPESCQGCHPDAYAAWRASAHSRSKDTLSATQQRDARCMSCHSPAETEQQVTNVTCESCHGGGQYYSARYVMKDPELSRLVGLVDPSEKGCRTCHDASSPSLKAFDFVAKLKAIDHWSVERAKRSGSGEKAEKAQQTQPAQLAGKQGEPVAPGGAQMIRVLDARFLTTATESHQYPKPAFPEVAFVGRSNVGKSSMINTLCNRRKLVRVSNTPGRTQTLNFFDVDLEVEKKKRTLRLCDLPGYGYAKASKTDRDAWRKMISRYLEGRAVLRAVVAIVDSEIGAQDSDVQMIEYLSSHPPSILVAATKIDRVSKSKWFGRRQKIAEALQVPLEAVVPFSSTERYGVDDVWDRLLGATLPPR